MSGVAGMKQNAVLTKPTSPISATPLIASCRKKSSHVRSIPKLDDFAVVDASLLAQLDLTIGSRFECHLVIEDELLTGSGKFAPAQS